MATQVIRATEEGAIERAAEVLRGGGLVVFPTDTVYGLAAHVGDREAIARIYEAKGRNTSRPIALLLSDVEHLPKVAVLPESILPLARRFWPGGLTLVVPKTDAVPTVVSPGPTVGVRIPDLDLARGIIRAAGGVLAVTSANLSGQPAALTAQEALEQLAGRVDLIVDGGPCRGGIPSTVLDCTVWPPAILREGAIPEAEIRAALAEQERQRAPEDG
ncbi:MAG TPA: threonylcarbamoyl-AMP synthase [Chloroflexi bacterium]|nr:threonylcarbamoyl-AMP synthase [Chloroflexota bacterium]